MFFQHLSPGTYPTINALRIQIKLFTNSVKPRSQNELVKYRNGCPFTCSIEQNTPPFYYSLIPPNVANPLYMTVEQKHPLRLVFGLSLTGYFGGSISPGYHMWLHCNIVAVGWSEFSQSDLVLPCIWLSNLCIGLGHIKRYDEKSLIICDFLQVEKCCYLGQIFSQHDW